MTGPDSVPVRLTGARAAGKGGDAMADETGCAHAGALAIGDATTRCLDCGACLGPSHAGSTAYDPDVRWWEGPSACGLCGYGPVRLVAPVPADQSQPLAAFPCPGCGGDTLRPAESV